MYSYRFSGLLVASEMELAGARGEAPCAVPDVTIRFGEVPRHLPRATRTGPAWDREGDTVLLRVPNLARFLVSEGTRILVALEDGASARDASAFVTGTSLGIVLHQRGALVLHGSAVAMNGRAIIVCGPSGAGKSTTAAALCRKGCDFVVDDVCAVTIDPDGVARVMPDGRNLKLWRQSIDALDLEDRRGGVVRETFEKYFVTPDAMAGEPPVLDAIYELRKSRPSLETGIAPLTPPDAMRMLENEAYRPRLRQQLTTPQHRMTQAIAVLRQAQAFTLTRPLGFETLDGTLDALLAHWRGLRP